MPRTQASCICSQTSNPDEDDWEFVEYSSSDPRERNDYDLPDAT